MWHPLTVHFPIALLLFATVTKLVAMFLKQPSALFWQRAASYLLYAGAIFAWLSIYTGNLADGIVSRKICDPTVLKGHENAAYYLAYLFSAATVADLCQWTGWFKDRAKLIRIFVLLLMLGGTWFLVQAGHSGARVVYQQAGGVNVPSSDCSEFM